MSEQDAAPSSTEPSILTEMIGEFKALGDKVEHLIHPNAPAADAVANSEPEPSPSVPDAVSTGDATDSSQPSQSESAGGLTGTEDPNAAATPAADPSASVTASSAPPASPASVMQVASDSGVLSRARLAIDRLRAHFWTFEASAVQKMHTELDFLEGLFK